MAKKLEETIRNIMLNEAGPDSIPGRVEPKPEFDELGGPIVRNDQGGIDFSKPIKPGQAALPKQGGGGPEKNPTKYKDENDLDPKKVMGEEEEKDEEDDDEKLEEGSRLPGWLKSKIAEETEEDDEDDDEKKDVDERYVRESDDEDEDDKEDDEEDVKEEDDDEEDEKEVDEEYFAQRRAEATRISEEAFAGLFEGRKINESFKTKLSTVFEAAVAAREEVIREEAAAYYTVAVEKVSKQIAESVTNTVDHYLDYVVEQWLDTNALAVENGIRSELTESFINNLKIVFEEHYIDIPEKKVNVVEALAARTEELEAKLNAVISENITLKEAVKDFEKGEMIREATQGLTESQASKFRTLAEGLDYTGSSFTQKLEVLKENVASTKKPVKKTDLNEDAGMGSTVQSEKSTDPLIAQATKILDRSTRK